MAIELVEANDVKTGRGGGNKGKGERYSKYVQALGKHVDWIKESIDESKDGKARIKSADLAKTMGLHLRKDEKGEGLSATALYWGVKYAAFKKNLVVTNGITKSTSEPLLIFRHKIDGDILPASLAKEEHIEEVDKEIEA